MVAQTEACLALSFQSGLPGFYDPCVGEEKSLKVLYQFRGVMHQVLSGDTEPLRIPKQCKSHRPRHSPAAPSQRDVLSDLPTWRVIQHMLEYLRASPKIYCAIWPTCHSVTLCSCSLLCSSQDWRRHIGSPPPTKKTNLSAVWQKMDKPVLDAAWIEVLVTQIIVHLPFVFIFI